MKPSTPVLESIAEKEKERDGMRRFALTMLVKLAACCLLLARTQTQTPPTRAARLIGQYE